MQTIKTFTHQGKTLSLRRVEDAEASSASPFDGATAGAAAGGGLKVQAPGAGKISIDELSLSTAQAAPRDAVTLSAVVRGDNIGHIFLDVLYHSVEGRADRYIGPFYRRFLIADNSHEISGVHYPRWETNNTVTCKFYPSLYLLADREGRAALACFMPNRYTPDPDDTDYTVDGRYTYAANGEQRRAALTFNARGKMTRAVSFAEAGLFAAAPRPVRPAQGDRFEPFIKIANPRDWKNEDLLGDAVAVREDLQRRPEPPLPGSYRVGLLVKDHDGNVTRSYTHLEVSGSV
jgi:hypothetical protein